MQRFASAVLHRYKLQAYDIKDALKRIETHGDVSVLLGHYQKVMSMCDVSYFDLAKNEEHHRNIMYFTLFKAPFLLEAYPEYQVHVVS